MAVKPIPEGYRTYTPYYVVDGAAEFIEFLKKAFGAEETFRMPAPGGRIGHAEVRIGNSMLMLADASPPDHPVRQLNGLNPFLAPEGHEVRPKRVERRQPGGYDAGYKKHDVNAAVGMALQTGAKGRRQPENMFYGDRMGGVTDKWGNEWMIGTHVEDVSPEEMRRRVAAQKKP